MTLCTYCGNSGVEVATSTNGTTICGACISAASLALTLIEAGPVSLQPELLTSSQRGSYEEPFSRPGETEAIGAAARHFGLSC